MSGVVEADSVDMATAILTERGYIPSKIKEKAHISGGLVLPGFMEGFASIKPPDLTLFTKQF